MTTRTRKNLTFRQQIRYRYLQAQLLPKFIRHTIRDWLEARDITWFDDVVMHWQNHPAFRKWHMLSETIQRIIQLVVLSLLLIAVGTMCWFYFLQPKPALALSPTFSSTVQHWEHHIQRWSRQYDLNPNLIASIMQVESCGNPNLVSDTGEYGLFQVPEFAFGASEAMLNPNTNAERVLDLLQRCSLSSGGDTNLTIGCYASGNVHNTDIANWSQETFDYWVAVSGIYDEARGVTDVPNTATWIERGGYYLCQGAGAGRNTNSIVRR